MVDEPTNDDPRWLREPPGRGEVHVYVKAGDGVELTEEARGALDRLMQELRAQDVEGFAFGVTCAELYSKCYPFSCTLEECQPLYSRPCLADSGCKIAEFGRMR